MSSHFADDIQVVLLFDAVAGFETQFANPQDIGARLQAGLQGTAPCVPLNSIAGPDLVMLKTSDDRCHFSVQRFDTPMSLNGFADVLANPIYLNTRLNLIAAVQNHQRALLISVGAGAVPGLSLIHI